jgi:hypothetical protein
MNKVEKEKVKKITDWLAKQPLNAPFNGKADERLRELLKGHPEYPKRFEGMHHFESRPSRYPGSAPALYAVWPDGRFDCFSYRSCVTGRGEAPIDTVKRAFRAAVEDQVGPHRRYEHDVHHARKSFDALFIQFCIAQRLDPEEIDINEDAHGLLTVKNEFIRSQWQVFHRENSSLVLVPRTVHQRLRRKTNVA